jgi:hypothetical protein
MKNELIRYSTICALSINALFAHTFNDIDLDLYDRINLEPRCDSLTVTYVTGESAPLQAICQPYKLAVDQPDGWGGYITIWEDRKEGPKIELENGVDLAKTYYALQLASASAAFTACTNTAVTSFIINSGFCLLDGILGSESYQECYDDELEAFITDVLLCESRRDTRLEEAITDANNSIDSFIAAYSGCNGVDALVELWQDYWDDLILK